MTYLAGVFERLIHDVLAPTSKASDAVHRITSGIAAFRSTGATYFLPTWLSYLAKAYADLGQFDDAWHCIGEAIVVVEKTKETWWEAEVNRIAGEIALMSPERDTAKAEAFLCALHRPGPKRLY